MKIIGWRCEGFGAVLVSILPSGDRILYCGNISGGECGISDEILTPRLNRTSGSGIQQSLLICDDKREQSIE